MVADSRFQIARMSVRTPWVDAKLHPDFIADLEQAIGKSLGEGLNFELTGATVRFGEFFTAIVVSMMRSYRGSSTASQLMTRFISCTSSTAITKTAVTRASPCMKP
jgi:hypothetical protein